MIPVIVTVFIWAVIAFAIGLVCAYVGIRFMLMTRNEKHAAEELVKKVEIRTRKEYNKIACLSPKELSSFLTVVFSRRLILVSEQEISEKQMNAHEELYARALAGTLEYLGQETVDAIEYYYGTNYIERWCHEAYLALEHDSIASSIINKERSVESVARRLNEWQ